MSGIDITDHLPTYKNCLVQWISLAVRDGIQGVRWESTGRQSKITQIIPWSKVKDLLAEPSGHLGINKTLGKVRQWYYWLQARNNVESGVAPA
jgi:hypothetical protein